MSLYFFNVYNSVQVTDTIGTECAGPIEVRDEAVRCMQELGKGSLLMNGDKSSITINVVDRLGKTVMIVGMAAYIELVLGSSLLS
jgi:hypothetical protein